jgi:hypothetical protein
LVRQSQGARDGLVDVGDASVGPATYLVPEDAKPACPAGPDGTFADHAALLTVRVTDWRHLDDEPCCPDTYFERRVVQVARRSPPSARGHGLEHSTVESDGMATGTKGQPVQVDRRLF